MISKHWKGTDALKLVKYPPGKFIWKIRIFAERILWKFFESMIDRHFVVHPRLCKYLIDFGIPEKKISVKLDYGKCNYCMKICSKKEHKGINIAYYYPGDRGNRKFKQWVYGKDIIDQIIPVFPDINWIHLDSSRDMCEIYPILDGYIRPNRHDGFPRIIIECLILNIPYYWDESFKPSVGAVYVFVKKIKRRINEKI